MIKYIIYLLLPLMLFSCKKEKDGRDPYAGTWNVTSINDKTDTAENNYYNVCSLSFQKDAEEEDATVLNTLTLTMDALVLSFISELQADGCLTYLGNGSYQCYWYVDDNRLFLHGHSSDLRNHVEVCTLTLDGDQLKLIHVVGDPTEINEYDRKQRIELVKQ